MDYLKLIHSSVRAISDKVELILYDDGSTDGTKEWLTSLNEPNTITHILPERVGHTILYDRGFKEANNKIIGILHADMIVHKNFFKNILKHVNSNNIVCGTCVEPPLHPPGNEKHIFNAGMYPDEFNPQQFDAFCDQIEGGISEGIFAPWFLLKEEYFNKLGGHDVAYAPYGYEDSDLFSRMALSGFNFVQSRDALVYHFTQRGHKWTKGIGVENEGYREQMEKTRRIYVKKFGTDPIFDQYHKPTPAPKYDIGFAVSNLTPNISNIIEPYCSTLSLECDNEVVVEFDANHLNNDNIQILFKLPLILQDSGEVGEFKLDIFSFKIKALTEHQNSLIKVAS